MNQNCSPFPTCIQPTVLYFQNQTGASVENIDSQIVPMISCRTRCAPDCRSHTRSLAKFASYGFDYQRLTWVYLYPRMALEFMTDTMGRMHSDAQFAGSSSVPAHVEMMGFLGMGNNPMVGATVAIAVAIQQAMN